ncbi:hypothetical protein BDW74DRAFT_187501 [Aspergillus multicolor]|uniref:uncharacterized protein n=1 Tax=Aspergillus multicolor TaxID=41759 RepID=UPI003CCDDF58
MSKPSAAVFCPQNRPPRAEYLQQLRRYMHGSPAFAPFVQAILDLPKTWTLYADINPAVGQMTSGAQGFCGGLQPVMAIAASQDEAEVLENAAKVLRIALCVGACGELGDDPDDLRPTTLVIRPKFEGQANEIVARYPGTYISAVADPLSISTVGPAHTLAELEKYAKGEGVSVTELHLRGKVHNPENRDLSKELCDLCHAIPELCLPDSSALQAPVRSNKTGQFIADGVSLTKEVLETALVSCCEWYSVMEGLADDLHKTGESSHTVGLFDTGRKNCLPPMAFEQRQLEVNKVDVVIFVESINDGPRLESFPDDAIAIVGAACRFPGARSLDDLWELHNTSSSRVAPLPLERLDPASHTWYGNFIDDVQAFNNAFFGISPRESSYMDPQQRLLLEAAYEALNSSGYLRSHNRDDFDNVRCFLGSTYVEYLENTISCSPAAYAAPRTICAFQSGRISYHFGWSGQSEVVDTACSSSLVAIHRACRAIQAGECPMALAGGANIITGIHNFIHLGKAGFLSPSGQCKPFDATAEGYCRADGLGLMVLKSLRQAINDGDHVLGVISAVATNHGGLSRSITVPYSRAQTSLFRRVLDQSQLSASEVSYAETHDTGTQVGDPIEMSSVREVLGGSQRHDPLHIGSVKANVGHSGTAAGVASLLKVFAMIQNAQIPPLAGFQSLNPKIPAIEPDNIRIPTMTVPWNKALRAGLVNSYGAAGSNSALICCEPPRAQQATGAGAYPVFMSASTSGHLNLYAAKLLEYIKKTRGLSLANLAFTLRELRQHHSTDEPRPSHDMPSFPKPVVLLFSGQSKQNVQLDRAWYDRFPPVFDTAPLSNVVVLQCGIFAVQYATTIGHSFGELTALAVSDILSLHDAIKLISARASLMKTKWGDERGTMLVVHTSHDIVEQFITRASQRGAKLEIACFNSPQSQVLVRSLAGIETVEKMLQAEGQIKHQRVNVSHGFHSVFIEPILEDLGQAASELTFNSPSIPIESCTQDPLETVTSERIAHHTRTAVYFAAAVARLEERLGQCIWLEAGSESPIIPMTRKAVKDAAGHILLSMKANSQDDTIATTTAALWREGVSATFWSFLTPKDANVRPIWLPSYQFQRTIHWLDHLTTTADGASGHFSPKLPPTPTQLVTPRRKASDSWDPMEFTIHTRTRRFTDIVSAHAVRGQPLCPASMYMEAAVMAVLAFQGALGIKHSRDFFLSLNGAGEYLSWKYSVSSGAGNQKNPKFTTHATGRLTVASQPEFFDLYARVISDRMQSLLLDPRAEKLRTSRAYALFPRVVEYSDLLRDIAEVTLLDNHAVAHIKRPSTTISGMESTVSNICDAVQLDTFIQVVGLLINSNGMCPIDGSEAFIATHIDSIVMHNCNFSRPGVDEWTVYAMASPRGDAQVAGDMFVFAKDELVMTASGLERLLQATNVSGSKPARHVGFHPTGIEKHQPVLAVDLDEQTLVASAAHRSSKSSPELSIHQADAVTILNQLKSHVFKQKQGWKETLLSLASICEDLIPPEADPIHLDPLIANKPDTLNPSKAKSDPEAEAGQMRARQRLLELISGNSGGGMSLGGMGVGNESMLQDLGIDSLLIIELQGALGEAFGVEFGDERVQLQSTVWEILGAVAVAVC